MSDSLRPHGLYSLWNSPGQNTEMGSLFLLQGIFSTQGSNPGLPYCRRILCQLSQRKPKNTRVGSHSLLHGIFPIQGSNPGLPYCRRILYHLSHQGSLYSTMNPNIFPLPNFSILLPFLLLYLITMLRAKCQLLKCKDH